MEVPARKSLEGVGEFEIEGLVVEEELREKEREEW